MDSLKKGKCVIINMETFDPSQKLDNRKGTDKDANSLKEVFESLGFTVQIKKNATHQEIVEVLNEAAQPDASQWSCFVFVVLSHGEEGRFHCFDDIVEVENLFSKFRECKGLVGKPKLFFFQACRGEKRDCGVTTYSTAVKKNEYKIPVEADFLCHYSTPLGFLSLQDMWHIETQKRAPVLFRRCVRC
ncbi:caspase-7-like isoform X2 [Pyxicephalus adspersus]|uniref:caspase-7-like isoform X2 n=1 Tax=Pyxicephalus adspersus TaxID=30357 RepID=UPI003B5B56DA